jgi:hypothetical protein
VRPVVECDLKNTIVAGVPALQDAMELLIHGAARQLVRVANITTVLRGAGCHGPRQEIYQDRTRREREANIASIEEIHNFVLGRVLVSPRPRVPEYPDSTLTHQLDTASQPAPFSSLP